MDAILDKVSKHGYENLTAEEKDFLFPAIQPMTAKRSTFRPVWSLLFLIPGGMGVVLAELAVRVPRWTCQCWRCLGWPTHWLRAHSSSAHSGRCGPVAGERVWPVRFSSL